MIEQTFDLLIIGAGVNGAGIARDAAGRGLSVALVDAGDIGGATSAASTKLIHGGLRYLEFYEFGLVRKALAEREVLLDIAPHITWPLAFVLPQGEGMRPAWMVRAGLFLYDHLAKRRQVPGSVPIDLRQDRVGHALDRRFEQGFRYWDGWVDDSRLVIINALDAHRRGALVRPRCGVVQARYAGDIWRAELADGGRINARTVVNAAGPWAEMVARDVLGLADAPKLRLIQGAHIVTRRVNHSGDALILQQPDGRIIFIIPYESDFSLIGTTETAIEGPRAASITPAEQAYLLKAANRYLARPLTADDIVHSFAGVRPLVLEKDKDARETTRDWLLIEHEEAPAITIVGGKITTYRLLGEAVMKLVAPKTKHWTANEPLPGGDVPRADGETGQEAFVRWYRDLISRFEDYDPALVTRLTRLYGTAAQAMLAKGLGRNLGGIFEAELQYLVEHEWATTVEDVLWRRTKLGLHLGETATARVADWFEGNFTAA